MYLNHDNDKFICLRDEDNGQDYTVQLKYDKDDKWIDLYKTKEG